jgi:deoxycytidine triphosphate deaminase
MIILKRNFAAREIIVENARSDPDEHVTIDLCVGDRYQIAGRPTWYDLKRPIPLRPKSCILIKTQERVTMPPNVFGMLCSKGSLSANGLIVSNTKIDPLFGDQLNIPVFNAGRKTLRVRPGMPFCSVSFHTLEQEVPTRVYRRAISQSAPRRTLTDWIRDQANILSLVVALLALSASVIFGLWSARRAATIQQSVSSHASLETISPTPAWSAAATPENIPLSVPPSPTATAKP